MAEIQSCPTSAEYLERGERTWLIVALHKMYDEQDSSDKRVDPPEPPAIAQSELEHLRAAVVRCTECLRGQNCNLGSLILGNRPKPAAVTQRNANPYAWYYR